MGNGFAESSTRVAKSPRAPASGVASVARTSSASVGTHATQPGRVGAGGGRRLEHPVDVALADSLAAQANFGFEEMRGQPAARHVDDDAVDLDPRHALGGVDRKADRALGRVEIDDRARFHAARALMADAEHPAAMGALAQRRRSVHRRQARDQADDLGGADVEHRQDGDLRGAIAACAA